MASPSPSSSTAPSPSSTDSGRPSISGGSNSSNLYLVTFLATLFLLLFVSCAIVTRSYILRRRFQRHLDNAFAAGIMLAPRAQGSHKKRYGAKPKIHEAYLAEGGTKWVQMMPLSAQPLLVKRRSKDGTPKLVIPPQSDAPAPPQLVEPRRRRALQSIAGATRSMISHIPAVRRSVHEQPTEPQPEKPQRVRSEILQVAILVAMPSPARRTKFSMSEADPDDDDGEEDEDALPELAIGVARWSGYKQAAFEKVAATAAPETDPQKDDD